MLCSFPSHISVSQICEFIHLFSIQSHKLLILSTMSDDSVAEVFAGLTQLVGEFCLLGHVALFPLCFVIFESELLP